MREGDARITLKALYVLHRFAANGAVEQSGNFQARLQELSRLVDARAAPSSCPPSAQPSAPPVRFFDPAGMVTEGRKFVNAYADYTLFRAKNFGPGFPEVGEAVGELVGGEEGGEGGREAGTAGGGVAGSNEKLPVPSVMWREGGFDAFVDRLEGLLVRAWKLRVGPGEEVDEVVSACLEAVYFDAQQVLESLGGHLKLRLRQVGSEEEARKMVRVMDIYEEGVEGLNEYVSRHRTLVEGYGIVMAVMEVEGVGELPRVPAIEEVGGGEKKVEGDVGRGGDLRRLSGGEGAGEQGEEPSRRKKGREGRGEKRGKRRREEQKFWSEERGKVGAKEGKGARQGRRRKQH
jgi:hypothetical protein